MDFAVRRKVSSAVIAIGIALVGKRLFQFIGAVLLFVTLSGCGPLSGPGTLPKPELRDETVRKVMSYLHAKDAAGLKTMAPAEFIEVEQAADDWLRKWGGVSATDYEVSYRAPGGTTIYDATIHAKSANGSATTIPIWLSWVKDRWEVGPLGRHPNPVVTTTRDK
ncbi:hypothetical protein [Arthrobacter sp. NA-172]|uniref:hypothetical protein n=1 Tax=Arthrobacter sp. NA-172 TaxID=3367524 RepID=UPI003755218A